MFMKYKWMTLALNAMVGGGYIAAILLMIEWVSTGKLGIGAFLVPIAIVVLIALAWTVWDRRTVVAESMDHNIIINETKGM